jgi:hypothetical protein
VKRSCERFLRTLIISSLCLSFLNAAWSSESDELGWLQELGKNVKLEKGSLIFLNQQLKKFNIDQNVPYTVTFVCQNGNRGEDKCELIDVGFRKQQEE